MLQFEGLFTTKVFRLYHVPCSHLSSFDVLAVVQTQASEIEISRAKKIIDDIFPDNSLSSFSPPTCVALLLEFLKELPEPLTAQYHEQFIGALQHTTEALRIAELKALIRQLPELNRNCLMLLLRTLYTVQNSEKFNPSAKTTLASSVSQYTIWDADEDEYGRPSEDKARVFQLMIDNVIELESVQPGSSLRNRAKSAGVAPEDMKAAGTGGIGPGAISHSSPADSELKSVTSSVPLLDEGLAAVKQLSDSNEALHALVENLEDSLQSLDGLVIDVGVLRGRMDSVEQRQQDVEEKISQSVPSKVPNAGKDDSIASLEHKVEAWIQVVQTRLDDIESSHPDEDDGHSSKSIAREDVEKLVRDSVTTALENKDKLQSAAFEDWRKKMEADFNIWKDKIMLDAAKVVASQIADVTKRVDAKLAESEEKRAEQVKSAPKADPDELVKLRKRIDEAGEAEERLNERIDDLMRSVEDLGEQLKASESENQKSSEPLKALQTQVASLEKRQSSQDEELAGLVALRSKVDTLLHPAQAPALSQSDDAVREGLRKVEQALPEVLEELEALRESVGAVQERVGKFQEEAGNLDLKEKVILLEGAHLALQSECQLANSAAREDLGKVEQALPEVLEELDALRESFGALQERVGKLEEEATDSSLQEKVTKLEEAHAARSGSASEATSSTARENQSKAEQALPELLEELEALRESFAEMQERMGKLEEDAGGSSLQEKVTKLEEAHETLRQGHAVVSEGHAAAQATSSALNAEVDRLSSALESLQSAAASTAPAASAGGASSREGVEEAFGGLFAEHVSPEIASLREAVHALQALIGKPSGSAGEGGRARGMGGRVFGLKLCHLLWAG